MFTWFIAKRLYFHSDGSRRVSHLAMQIATAGVAIGLAVMLVSVAIVLGFQKEIESKVLGFGSHIQVINYESLSSEEYKPIVVDSQLVIELSSLPFVSHVQRFCMKPGMLKTEDSFRGIVFRGVGSDYDLSFLRQSLVEGNLPIFSEGLAGNQILVSRSLANQMNLKVGMPVYAYFFENSVRARKFVVAGIYCTNLTDFDNQLVFAPISTIHTLLRWDSNQYSGVELQLQDLKHIPATMPQLITKLHNCQDAYAQSYTCMAIQEMYPQIFAWLDLLNMDVWVILVLMIFVAGFTTVSGLLIIILERTNFIGIMKALGAGNASVRRIFLCFASLIIVRGIIYGNLLAFAIILLQRYTGLIHLDPEVYYVESVPVLVNLPLFILINAATLLISFFALIIPSYLVSNIHPARSIQFE